MSQPANHFSRRIWHGQRRGPRLLLQLHAGSTHITGVQCPLSLTSRSSMEAETAVEQKEQTAVKQEEQTAVVVQEEQAAVEAEEPAVGQKRAREGPVKVSPQSL